MPYLLDDDVAVLTSDIEQRIVAFVASRGSREHRLGNFIARSHRHRHQELAAAACERPEVCRRDQPQPLDRVVQVLRENMVPVAEPERRRDGIAREDALRVIIKNVDQRSSPWGCAGGHFGMYLPTVRHSIHQIDVSSRERLPPQLREFYEDDLEGDSRF